MMTRHERIERIMCDLFVGSKVAFRDFPVSRESSLRLEWAYEWAESIVDYVDSRRLAADTKGNDHG